MTAQAITRPAPESAIRFADLQDRLVDVEGLIRAGEARSVVVVPSRTIDRWDEPAAVSQAFEERLLCSLLELRDPRLRMTYVTSSPIAPPIVDYYLSLLPRRARRPARSRLTLVALGERTVRPLSQKLLDRPLVLERIRRSIPDLQACHLAPFTATPLERELALALQIPMYGADPCHSIFGTKSGARALFAAAGVPHPAGLEGIRSASEAIDGIVRLRAAKPELARIVLKLNEGVSGQGNAIVDLADLPLPGSREEPDAVARRVTALVPEAEGVTPAAFLKKLAASGGVIEEWIVGRELHSPSVQLQITPWGEVRVVSTHDQILGGPTGQSYLGCRFPAAPSYAAAISAHALRIGEHLAAAGVIGRLAIDFVVTRDERRGWQPFAIEVNLRKGGTTHSYETLASLTGGRYNSTESAFTTATGQHKHYVATDHMEAPELRALGREGVLALARRSDLRFDPLRRAGVVFHMLSSLDEIGRTGFTAIADSAEEAAALFDRVEATLMAETSFAAGREAPLSVAA
jgi:PGM1 C-terminal domain